MATSLRSRRCDRCDSEQVLPHQELGLRHVLVAESPQRVATATASSRAGLRVPLAERLADVVEQRAEIERLLALDLAHRLRRRRQLLGELAARQRLQPPDRVELMLVDGEHVIEVVLHARRCTAPTRASPRPGGRGRAPAPSSDGLRVSRSSHRASSSRARPARPWSARRRRASAATRSAMRSLVCP